MARTKAASVAGMPDVASRGRFDALALHAPESDSEGEAPVPAAATSLSPSAPSTPSKKALARQRAKLRKKNSTLSFGLETNGDDSDRSSVGPATSTVPPVPVPAFPSKVQVNGVKDQVVQQAEKAKEEVVQQIEAVVPEAKPVEPIQPTSSVPNVKTTPPAPESVTTEEGGYDDEDDDEEEEEEEDVAPHPSATLVPSSDVVNSATPRPSSPARPAPTPATNTKPKEAYTGADHDPKKKIKAIITRTIWGVAMAGGAVGLVAMGHVYVIALVFVVQALVFKELTGLFDAGYSGAHVDAEGRMVRSPERELKRKGRKEERERWSRRMAWYFFAATNYYLYGESLIYYFKHILTLQASFLPTAYSFAQHHRLISFGLYVIGFVGFVANLSRANLRRQFGLFGWIHMSLLLIVVSSHFIVNNILEGMIWFWVPASLVIINDVAAYVCGMLFGRHQLIKLSPKKTVEGFVGAFFVTIIFAVGWSTFFMRFNYMICPAQDLSTNVFSDMHCTPNHVFEWRQFPLPQSVTAALEPFIRRHVTSIPWAPFQLHSIVLAVFASLVAPFGGFFASGFKRAFDIKDFGDSIPGHGGMTDRMDCQFMHHARPYLSVCGRELLLKHFTSQFFTYVYYASLIRETHVTPQSVLATVVTHLTTEQQVELMRELGKLLVQKGVKAAVPW
ncbi:hypothetical protein JCM5296_006331 [Sporobolomyces johnsonii]